MSRLVSPFAVHHAPFDFVFKPIDYKKEELKRYVYKNAYMPPITNARSLDVIYSKFRRDQVIHSEEAGSLFAKRKAVSFNDNITRHYYDLFGSE